MTDPALREIRAVLEADLRVSGATTLEALHEAAVASLTSLVPDAHEIIIERDLRNAARVNVLIEGPMMIGSLAIAFQPSLAEPSDR